jgi:RNA polymerase sigma-70 factor (ECF subfamily)
MSGQEPSWHGDWLRKAVEQYEERLVRYATRIVGCPDRAQDAVQQTFLQLCRQDRGRVEGHLAEWLYTVCRNEALATLRKGNRERSLEQTDTDSQASHIMSPPDAVLLDESLARVLRLLATLSGDQQETIRLRYEHGLTYRQISQVTGLSVTNVGSLIHRGLKKLREDYGRPSHETESR